ncbi:hypothetical protein LPY66_14175 [Dehalobacter sp. DCM]|uniref:hypothetical protein n=1 Tax=Dehalobacter sp. DCM TaxID=2907827 RepID=UPI003081DE97|nr:hypothetical protein LPY66_14175 [Dehalobacter sp. DCM]
MFIIGKIVETELVIVDTTLCDGEQTTGADFSNRRKPWIIRMLDEIGITFIKIYTVMERTVNESF